MKYTRIENSPLKSTVVVTNNEKSTTFQLQPRRDLTDTEKEIVSVKGLNPSDFCWVGFIVRSDSEPVMWSKEIQKKVNDAKDVLKDAVELSGEVCTSNNPFMEMFGQDYKFHANHFLGSSFSDTEENAQDSVPSFVCGPKDNLWVRTGNGTTTEKYGY